MVAANVVLSTNDERPAASTLVSLEAGLALTLAAAVVVERSATLLAEEGGGGFAAA